MVFRDHTTQASPCHDLSNSSYNRNTFHSKSTNLVPYKVQIDRKQHNTDVIMFCPIFIQHTIEWLRHNRFYIAQTRSGEGGCNIDCCNFLGNGSGKLSYPHFLYQATQSWWRQMVYKHRLCGLPFSLSSLPISLAFLPSHLHCPTNWPAPCRPQLHLLTKCQPPPLMLLDLVLPNPITVHCPTSSSKCCGPTFAPQHSLNLDALPLNASSQLAILLIQHHSPNFMAVPPHPIQPPSSTCLSNPYL